MRWIVFGGYALIETVALLAAGNGAIIVAAMSLPLGMLLGAAWGGLAWWVVGQGKRLWRYCRSA